MIGFRWLVLRIFFSLLALPFVAFALLWLLHEIIYPGEGLPDLPAIGIIWVMILALVDGILRRQGIARYNFLQERAQSTSDNDGLETVFVLARGLFASGLLPPRSVARLQAETRRLFLSLHAKNLLSREALEELQLALRQGCRREEIYALLKNHVLSQPALTIGVIDLAEELLEHRPDDGQLLEYMTRKFAATEARHDRAEYFYKRHLAAGGEHIYDIIALCLKSLLAMDRQDDFALWIYVRAFAAAHSENVDLCQKLMLAHKRNQQMGRNDELAAAVAQVVRSCAPEVLTHAQSVSVEQPALLREAIRQRLADGLLRVRRAFLEYYSVARSRAKAVYDRHRRYVLLGAAIGVSALSLVFLLVNQRVTKSPAQAVVESNDNAAGYFALQVGAWKKERSAGQEKQRLQRAGLSVRVLQPRTSSGWYRIHLGKYRSRRSAQVVADSLKRAGVIEDYFVANYDGR